MEENLDQRELQLEEKRMILEIAIRVNDLRSYLIFAFLSSKLTEDVTDLSVSVTSLRCCLWTTATWRPSPGSAATSAWAPTAPAPAMRWAGIGGELSRDHTAHLWLVRRAPTATAAAPTSGSARPARRTLSHSRTPAKKFRRCGGHTFINSSIHLLKGNRLVLSHCHRVCSWRRFSLWCVNLNILWWLPDYILLLHHISSIKSYEIACFLLFRHLTSSLQSMHEHNNFILTQFFQMMTFSTNLPICI